MTDITAAPKQGDEGAPDAWLVLEPWVLEGLEGIEVGDEVIVVTWLDRANRDVLQVHPRGDVSRALRGVFGHALASQAESDRAASGGGPLHRRRETPSP